ncbi:hypothetical protein CC80DRAFT_589704 [Byssothecium circinans]|uniref:Uncharacterized protein n=1 Tax=Byssothecium circinans TaxID=147558 RepID=A0A6A5UBI4_9PLEO|nr:hypothetical protein CC80DRAFT_589704 [Byssothecium circinans]
MAARTLILLKYLKGLFKGRKSLRSPSRRLFGFEETGSEDRYAASTFLKTNGIANVIWLEDVLAHYGSDTQAWDLNLLVQNTLSAAEVLQNSGYNLCTPCDRFSDDPGFCGKSLQLSHPSRDTKVVLYCANDWYFELEPTMQSTMPLLNQFIDALMEMWLNISLRDYVERIRFALHIAVLLRYCYYLTDPNHGPVKSTEYASNLRKEHRELHYDIVAGDPQKYFAQTERHRHHVRRYTEIKNGEFDPQPYKKGVYKPELAALHEESQSSK